MQLRPLKHAIDVLCITLLIFFSIFVICYILVFIYVYNLSLKLSSRRSCELGSLQFCWCSCACKLMIFFGPDSNTIENPELHLFAEKQKEQEPDALPAIVSSGWSGVYLARSSHWTNLPTALLDIVFYFCLMWWSLKSCKLKILHCI